MAPGGGRRSKGSLGLSTCGVERDWGGASRARRGSNHGAHAARCARLCHASIADVSHVAGCTLSCLENRHLPSNRLRIGAAGVSIRGRGEQSGQEPWDGRKLLPYLRVAQRLRPRRTAGPCQRHSVTAAAQHCSRHVESSCELEEGKAPAGTGVGEFEADHRGWVARKLRKQGVRVRVGTAAERK